MTDRKTARFIAGAVCPECRAQDRIKLVETPEGRQRRCVACGFEEQERRESAQVLPFTRFSGPAGVRGPKSGADPADDERARPVRVLDPAQPPPEGPQNT